MRNAALFAGLLLMAAIEMPAAEASASPAESGSGPRATRSAEGFAAEREPDARRDAALLDDGDEPKRRVPRAGKPGSEPALRSFESGDAWIYDADVELYDDLDGDGYYHYLRVRFDADSYFESHWVYARLYLSDDGEFWEEYHVTRDFLIEGSSPHDDFEVETELASGFPSGLYDVLIELYDADYGDFLAEYGPADSSAFSLLPLEDRGRDLPPPPVVVVTREHGGGGSAGLVTLAVLAALLFLAARRRRGQASVAMLGAGFTQ